MRVRVLPLLLAVLLAAGCGSAPAGPGRSTAPPEASTGGTADAGAADAGAAESKLAQAGLESAALTGAARPAPPAAAATPAAPAPPAGEFAPAVAGAGGHTLPRCTGWIWEGGYNADGARQLDVTVLTLPNQPIFPTLACWAREGVTPPDPAIRVLQADGLQVHAARHEHYSQKENRHLWIFSITAPPLPGFYYIRYQVDGVEWVTIPFEVGTPQAVMPGN